MRVWLTSFILLFGAAELFQWLREITLPLPVFILGGAFLAIASNYDKLSDLPFPLNYQEPTTPPEIPASQASKVVLPATPKVPSERPISFEIRKPFKPGD